MKSIAQIVYGIAFLLCINVQEGWSQTPTITGEWKIDYQALTAPANIRAGFVLDSLSQDQLANLETTFSSRIFLFNADLSMNVSFESRGRAISVPGTWNYDTVTNQLAIDLGNTSRTYTVDWISGQMHLTPLQQPASAVFNTLILDKQ